MYFSMATDVFDQCLTGLSYIICLNSKILRPSSSEFKLQKLFSLVTEKNVMAGLISLLLMGSSGCIGSGPGKIQGTL